MRVFRCYAEYTHEKKTCAYKQAFTVAAKTLRVFEASHLILELNEETDDE